MANPQKLHSRYARGRQNIVLPVEGRTGPVPDVPDGRDWTPAERVLWAELWTSPQATAWLDSQRSAVGLYVIYACAVFAGEAAAWQATEARHLADRLGLTPAGLTSLGWLLPDEEGERERVRRGSRSTGGSLARAREQAAERLPARDRFRVVPD